MHTPRRSARGIPSSIEGSEQGGSAACRSRDQNDEGEPLPQIDALGVETLYLLEDGQDTPCVTAKGLVIPIPIDKVCRQILVNPWRQGRIYFLERRLGRNTSTT